MPRHPVTKRPLRRPPTNGESIREIPDTHIDPAYKATLYLRALDGDDVYAYGSFTTGAGIINIWDTDTRIPLFPLAQWRWELAGQHYESGSRQWVITFKQHNGAETQQIAVWVDRLPDDGGDLKAYINRSIRRGKLIEHYINLYGDEPNKYDNLHF